MDNKRIKIKELGHDGSNKSTHPPTHPQESIIQKGGKEEYMGNIWDVSKRNEEGYNLHISLRFENCLSS